MNIQLKKDNKSIESFSEADTHEIASEFAQKLSQAKVICLKGQLGSGKTTFVKGFLRAFGIESKRVKSPTYTYMRIYKINEINIYHFDYYRVNTLDDLMIEEFQDILNMKNSILVVEWPEIIEKILPNKWVEIEFKHGNEQNHRNISIKY